MSEVVIEVGPATIRGANDVRQEWVSTALDCIDDQIALLDDHPVSVRDVWDDVMSAAAGTGFDTAVVICPAWWSSARIDRVREAAQNVATEIVVLERIALLREGVSAETTIVEITAEAAVVSVLGTATAVIPLQAESDAEAVTAAVGAPAMVLLDAPASVLGAEFLASKIADRMRAIGVRVRIVDDEWVLRAAATKRSFSQALSGDAVARGSGVFRDRKVLAALSGILMVVILCCGFATVHDSSSDSPVGDMPMTLLVEGRIGVMVPAAWIARRITSGAGSARVQLVSPVDHDIALHITQSVVSPPSSLATTADSLLRALEDAADGAFVEFNPSDRRADRDAVTYREVRPERHVAWTVLVDGTVRIAVGCQSTPGREHLVGEACDRAIRSAHAMP